MKLFTKVQEKKLLANGKASSLAGWNFEFIDPKPVVKLVTPDSGLTWLLSEIDPHDPDIAFGLCDLGKGNPELGYVSISELKKLRGSLNLPVERDRHWTAKKTLSEYKKEASEAYRIVA